MLASEASVKDMEAAAIASIASDYDVPLVILKVITDLVDAPEKTEEFFMQNLHKAGGVLNASL